MLTDLIVIIVGVVIADALIEIVKFILKMRRKQKLDINCDNCKEPRKIIETPDGMFWLCSICYKAYLEEHPELKLCQQCNLPRKTQLTNDKKHRLCKRCLKQYKKQIKHNLII